MKLKNNSLLFLLLCLTACSPRQDVRHTESLMKSSLCFSEWAKIVKNKDLEHIMGYACLHAESQKMAAARYQAASAAYQGALAASQFSLTPSISYVDDQVQSLLAPNKKQFRYQQYMLSFSLPVDVWGAGKYHLKAAEAAAYAVSMNQLAARQQLMASIFRSYFTLKALENIALIRHKQETLKKEILKKNQEALDAGLYNQKSVYQASISQQAQTISDLELTILKDAARAALMVASTVPKSDLKTVLSDLPIPPKIAWNDQPFAIVRSRPDVRYFEANYLEKLHLESESIARQYPNISLSSIARWVLAPQMTLSPASQALNIAFANLNPHAIQSPTRYALWQRVHAYEAWKQSLRQALSELEQTALAYHHKQQAYLAAVKIENHARELLQWYRAQHLAGLLGDLDLMQQEYFYLGYQEQRIQKQLESLMALADWHEALGSV